MKKVIVKNLEGVQTHGAEMEDPTAWIADCEASCAWGVPTHPELDADGKETGVIIPANYTVEIVDITAEHELAQVIAARKAEYPTPEEFMNAYFDGGPSALGVLMGKRLEIKAKYPKPGV
jgi:hypothetical protein